MFGVAKCTVVLLLYHFDEGSKEGDRQTDVHTCTSKVCIQERNVCLYGWRTARLLKHSSAGYEQDLPLEIWQLDAGQHLHCTSTSLSDMSQTCSQTIVLRFSL